MRQTESRFWRHSRREFLKIGGLGFGGLSLPVLQALSTSRASSCIILFQGGGSSQLDTFDPKPDAPSGIGYTSIIFQFLSLLIDDISILLKISEYKKLDNINNLKSIFIM